MDKVDIYIDGGSRGNPGPSACAFVVYSDDSEIFSQAKFLGVNTNNYAEYQGLITALQWVHDNQGALTSVRVFMDSELVVKQVNGHYKVKSENILPLFTSVKKLLSEIGIPFSLTALLRHKNMRADELVNLELDSHK